MTWPGAAIIERDLARLAGRPRTFALRTGLATLTGTACLFALLGASVGNSPDSVGQFLFRSFIALGSVLVYFAALFETAAAIPEERRRGTLPLLLVSPLSAREIAMGLFASRALLHVGFLVGLLPLGLTPLLLGGVSASRWAGGGLLLLLCTAQGAALGLLGGALSRDVRSGATRAVVLGTLWWWALPLGLPAVGTLIPFIAVPLDAMATVVNAAGPGALWEEVLGFGSGLTAVTLVSAVLGTSVLILLCAAGAGRLVRGEDEAAGSGVAVQTSAIPGEAAKRFALAGATGTRGALTPTGFWNLSDHPLAWRERCGRRGMTRRLTELLAPLLLLLGVALALIALSPVGSEELSLFIVCAVPWIGALRLIRNYAWFAEQRDAGVLETLRTTPLSPLQYVLARPLAEVHAMAPWLAAWTLVAAGGAAFGLYSPWGPLLGLLGAFSVAPFFAMLGAWIGVGARTPGMARRRMFAVTALGTVGWPIVALIAGCSLPLVGGFVGLFHPFVAMAGPLALLRGTDGKIFVVAGPVISLTFAVVGTFLLLNTVPDVVAEELGKDSETA